MAKFDDRLKDYVEVKDRIRLFYERYPDGRLCTASVKVSTEPDGVPRVWVEATAYRAPDDGFPAVGWSWMILPGSTPYTRGSELENTETSAWGRAIGALGIGIDGGIASAQEVRNKSGGETKREQSDDGGLIGKAEIGKTTDTSFELMQTPEGMAIGFRLTSSAGGIKVLARDPLASALKLVNPIGQRVTCYGRIRDETFTNKAGRDVTYQVLDLERISTPDGVLPAPGEPVEAPSQPLFELDEAEKAAIGGGLA